MTMISDEAGPALLTIDSLGDGRRVRLAGTLDMNTRDRLATSLRPLLAAGDDVHLDLSRLIFVDVSGATVLATSALRLPAGRRLVLERPPRQLRRILDLFWPELRCIEMVTR
jgi:ABC-type transporter Mla MlaB component